MPPIQPPLAGRPHRNQQLFANYYLDHVLPLRPGWADLVPVAAPVLAHLQTLFAGFTPSSSESQTEEDWITPVLRALGHTFEVQVPLKTSDGTKRPDYVFYRDPSALVAHKDKILTDQVAQAGALAVGDAKSWDLPLDQVVKKAGADPLTNKNRRIRSPTIFSTVARGHRILNSAEIERLGQFTRIKYESPASATIANGATESISYRF